jgi:mitogen-activated protein kinase 1/3
MDKKKQESKEQPNIPKDKHSFTFAGSTFIVSKKYMFIKRLGQGAYGVVCACLDTSNNKKVAIKKIPNAFEDLIDAKRIVREIKLLHFFEHPNIVNLVDIQKPEKETGFDDIYFATEFMETDLHKVIYSKQKLTDEHIQYFIYQILCGTYYMHSADIVHRDLKPSNILVNKNCDVKICDLGLGRGGISDNEEEKKNNHNENDKQDELTEYVITRWYRAPEVILCPSEYSKAVDVWSIGCIFAELLGRKAIFQGDHYLDQIKKITSVLGSPKIDDLDFISKPEAKEFILKLDKKNKIPFSNLFPNANPVALDLLEKMLTFHPKKRISVKDCLSHPYFKELRTNEAEIVSKEKFDWSFDDVKLTKANLQKMIYEESLYFHPKNNNE